MQTVMIKYQPFGIGEWTTLYVSTDVANALEKEYMSYGWPVEVNSECTELESDFAQVRRSNRSVEPFAVKGISPLLYSAYYSNGRNAEVPCGNSAHRKQTWSSVG
ncbi:TPA: hypothetical protein RQJ43_001140 [Vibrio vulnificus]|nr:hypothetical protein [Vibrio vulnificus]HDY7435396.1 hypothetical protein [Vibrio vulnificus]